MVNDKKAPLSRESSQTAQGSTSKAPEQPRCSAEPNGSSKEKEEMITEEANILELIPQAPDGGWGWVIVFASFMNHFIIDGICYAFGGMLAEYAAYFNSSAATTGALMSTLIGCYLLSAPVASALVNRYGCRIVGMVGAVIATASFILSTVSQSMEVLIFSLGICGGIGFGLMYLPAVVSVSMYFEKKRATAIGIATCGTGIGTFTFGPLGRWLMLENDWKTVHYILACVIIQGAVLYSLVFPLAAPKHKKYQQQQSKQQNSSDDEAANVLIAKPSVYGSIKLHRSTAFIGSSSKVPTSTTLTVEQASDLKRPMYKKDVFYSGSIYNLQEYKDVPNIQDYVASIVSIPAMHEVKQTRENICPCTCLPVQMTDVLNEMLDVSLFKSPSFNLIIFAILVLALAYFIPFAYCTPRAMQLGSEAARASFLISILGMSTMFGRLGACLIAQIPRLRALTLHNICIFGAGLSCVFIPLCKGYNSMAVAASVYGFCMGAHVSLSPIVLVDILGLNRLTTSFGLLTLARGVSTLAGPVLGGYLYDQTLSYDSGFYMAGVLIIVSAVLYCLPEIPYIRRQERQLMSESRSK